MACKRGGKVGRTHARHPAVICNDSNTEKRSSFPFLFYYYFATLPLLLLSLILQYVEQQVSASDSWIYNQLQKYQYHISLTLGREKGGGGGGGGGRRG